MQQATVAHRYAGIAAHSHIGAFGTIEHVSIEGELFDAGVCQCVQFARLADAVAVEVTPQKKLLPFCVAVIKNTVLISVKFNLLQGLQIA